MMEKGDADLVTACIAGQKEAFDALMLRYKAAVTNFAYSLSVDRLDAEEIAQEAFVRAYVNLSRLKRRQSFCSWVMGIAKKVYAERKRKDSRRQTIAGERSESASAMGNPHGLNTSSPDLELERSELRLAIAEAITSLSAPYQKTVILKHLKNLTCAQIAEIEGKQVGTITMRLSRAHKVLRRKLQGFL